jgi:flagellar motor switch protein FliN/FliY
MTSLEPFGSLSDISIDVEAQMDRVGLTVRQILELEENSVVKLSRSVGENIDILVGGAVIGEGEIVITQGRAAIRIADLREED